MDVTRGKVTNGYGQSTSKLSVTMIGQYNLEAEASGARTEQLKRDMSRSAAEEVVRSKCDHPSKLNLHFQKEYPETMNRLQNGDLTRAKTPERLKSGFTWNMPFAMDKEQDIVPAGVTRKVIDESQWNVRKREFNKGLATQAEVNNIINGTR